MQAFQELVITMRAPSNKTEGTTVTAEYEKNFEQLRKVLEFFQNGSPGLLTQAIGMREEKFESLLLRWYVKNRDARGAMRVMRSSQYTLAQT